MSFSYERHRATQIPARQALDDVSICIRKGAITALIGESGSGKSTLARLILGLMKPSAGSIQLNGRELTRMRRYPREYPGASKSCSRT